jgi:hypothetical protein
MATCTTCDDTGHVCEHHPHRPWDGISDADTACHCGGAGMPCPQCCDPIPEDGTHRIGEAFTPRHLTRDTRWAPADPRPYWQQWDQA